MYNLVILIKVKTIFLNISNNKYMFILLSNIIKIGFLEKNILNDNHYNNLSLNMCYLLLWPFVEYTLFNYNIYFVWNFYEFTYFLLNLGEFDML